MIKLENKKIQKAIVFALFVVLLFFCQGGSLGMALFPASMDMQSYMNMEHGDKTHKMPCCDFKLPLHSMSHDIAITNSFSDNLLKFIIFLSIAFFYLLFGKKDKHTNNLHLYAKKIKNAYGSWRRFVLFGRLLQTGILHPKTW